LGAVPLFERGAQRDLRVPHAARPATGPASRLLGSPPPIGATVYCSPFTRTVN